MSEQEKSGVGPEVSSTVVMVEQSAASRHTSKQAFRATELTEDVAELHHNLSKAPIVPPVVAEEIKDNEIINVDSKERRESERAISSEKHKFAAKKLSSTKRRASSPDAIAIEMDVKVGSVTPSTQPIPAQVSQPSITEVLSDKHSSYKKEDVDSITEEITTEIRTGEAPNTSSQMDNVDLSKEGQEENKEIKREISSPADIEVSSTSCKTCNHKEVSWNCEEYLKDAKIKKFTSHTTVVLESKASVGPCFYPTTPLGKPSGITICIPKKSLSISEMYKRRQSVINISIEKKTQINKTKPLTMSGHYIDEEIQGNDSLPRNCLGTIRDKISILGGRIKNALF